MGALDSKVAIITGGASGIGLATAERLADEGAAVVIVDRNTEAGQEVAARLGGRFVMADVGQPADWPRIVTAAKEEFGGVDIAYLNAGVTTGEQDITALTDEQYRRIMGPNVDGVVFGARAVAPAIAARGGGAIVATASLAGLIAFSPDPIYTMTKHAVVGLVRALAPQMEAKGITINAICPGIVDTPLVGDEPRRLLESVGFPMMPASQIAEAVLGCITGKATGEAWVCQPGRPAERFEFGGAPGPRADGAEGRVPPAGMVAHDQG